MRELLSALGAFEVVEVPKPEGDPLSWEPTRWVKYPLEDDAIASGGKPWIRPKQLRLAFTGVNVIDVVKSKVIKDQTVKLQGGKFTSISKTQAQDAQAGDWIVVDAKGLYMCPGLIDCHVHINERGNDEGFGTPDTGTAYQIAHALRGILNNGFTTVRDVAGANRYHREATEEWLIPGPRLFIGGPLLSQTGGHGDHGRRMARPSPYMIGDAHLGQMAYIVDGVDACLKAARKIMMSGADHIKICSSGGVLSPTDKLESSQFTVPEIQAITGVVKAMASQAGTLVTAHCFTSEGARNAMEGGVGCIEHGSLIDEDTLKLMASKNVHLCPTLIIQDIIVNGPLGKMIPPFSLEKAQKVHEATYTMMKAADKLGVNVAYGTDAPFEIQNAEFELRKKILPSPTILKHATCNAAKVVAMEGKLGCIKEGAFADFLLLDENPLEDVAVLGRPLKFRAVVKDGRCVRSTVDGLQVEVALNY